MVRNSLLLINFQFLYSIVMLLHLVNVVAMKIAIV